MSFRRFISLLILVLLYKFSYAQFEVKEGSFKEVPGFVNINTEKMYDDNDKPYAVLKIKTENIDGKQRRELNFGGDAQTFFEVEYKDGEVWLYISYYASYIKISHDDLSSVDFYFPFDMQPKKGYEMTLVNKTGLIPPVPVKDVYNYMIISADQPNAMIYIDDVYVGDDLPVERVSWNNCKKFIKRLNKLTGANFRLPTEAEWEYAARGGSSTSLYNGENIRINGKNNSPNLDRLAWYGGNCGQNYTYGYGCDVTNGYDISRWSEKQYNDSRGGTHPVGQKQPNAYGLYDMLGNVREWCEDWYGDYSGGSQTNPKGPSSGSYRVNRGGSWGSNVWLCRVSNRSYSSPGYRDYYLGFRVVLIP